MTHRWRISLYLKLVAGLLVVVMTPLLVSAYLIDQIGKLGANFGANEAAARDVYLERAIARYDDLFDAGHRLHAEIAQRLAARDEIARLSPDAPLDDILAGESSLVEIAMIDADGNEVARQHGKLPDDTPNHHWRTTSVEHPLPGGAKLELAFAVPDIQTELKDLRKALDVSKNEVQHVRSALPRGYRNAFLATMVITVVLTAAIGFLAAWSVTRRISVLVTTARKVSGGDPAARAALRGRDEMAELAVAFNAMLDDLDRQRREIDYLQRIGAWQDVARKLAHEIKNPLTPIQLAVQQCVSAYQAGAPNFARTLNDAGEIVAEEIAGLRRLVDNFRTFGQLPKVEAHPLALREVIDDLRREGGLADRLRVEAPAAPDADVTVSADKLLLKRVFANLAENAVHAGQDAGQPGDVVIGWRVDGQNVVVTVDDQGQGVAAADRERIFEPYMTTKPTGTGLGLAIARKIAIEHGGELSIAAERAPTGGARFVMTLPLGAAESSLA